MKRKRTKAAKKLPTDFEDVKNIFLFRVQNKVTEEGIPKEMIINIDEAASSFVPVANWTLEE